MESSRSTGRLNKKKNGRNRKIEDADLAMPLKWRKAASFCGVKLLGQCGVWERKLSCDAPEETQKVQ